MRLGPYPPLLAALLLAACGSSKSELHHCATSADCAADAFCRAGSCTASASPVAVVSAPATRPLRSHAILRFDGSLSHDPDPEDHVATFSWRFRATGAACEPFPPSATGQAADVVFSCGGAFEVELTVVDATGHGSAPSVLPVTVELSAVVPGVSLGPDASWEHRCAGTPLVCAPQLPGLASTFSLAAVPTAFPDANLTYQWTAIPPPLPPGSPAPRVTFDPPDGPTPAVRIETDGTAISGEYLFGVTVSDPFHLAAVAQQKVTIGNRLPGASGAPIYVNHTFDPVGSRFLASGTVPPFGIADPDGDPIEPLGFTAIHAGDGAGTFEVTPSGAGATFAIAVPYASLADGLYLRGGADLYRAVAFAARDVNGGVGEIRWPVEVLNRAPRLAGPLAPSEVDHHFDAAAMRYRADVPMAQVVDDDGDPLEQAGPTGSGTCPTLAPRFGSGTIHARCSIPYAGPGSLAGLLATHTAWVKVTDPWEQLQIGQGSGTVKNRPPVVNDGTTAAPGTCGPPECCAYDTDGFCIQADRTWSGPAATVPSVASDPDGDPIELTITPGGCGTVNAPPTACIGDCPPMTAHLCDVAGTCSAPVSGLELAVTATDGVQAASGTVSVVQACR